VGKSSARSSSPTFSASLSANNASQLGQSLSPHDDRGSATGTEGLEHEQQSSSSSPLLTSESFDRLLDLYFNFVHNVWPVIYKPAFYISCAKPVLTKAILAIAACIDKGAGLDIGALFDEAEDALLASRLHSHIETVQALILMSLRQTGCGNKSSAWMYAGMWCQPMPSREKSNRAWSCVVSLTTPSPP
jgi:Fungal specific transcription factor domain